MNIAINLVGDSFGTRNRDWRRCKNSLFEKVINCWDNYNISIYVTTYENETSNELIKCFNPKKYSLLNRNEYEQRTAYIHSLKQLTNENIDFVISTRFDIIFNEKISNYNIDFTKFNFLFREGGPWWTTHKFTTDTMFCYNFKFNNTLIESITEFHTIPYTKYPDLHPTYRYIVPKIGKDNINFMINESHLSHENPIYNLDRT